MPEDFEFDLNFEITSYTFSVVRGGDIFSRDGKGNVLSEEMKGIILMLNVAKEFGLIIFRQRAQMVPEDLIQLISRSSN